ncbi:response regulator [Leptospira gomenensis]|uniref:Response regulator n=1 Tax=Leptospira gomenensis TaxID=2484974 RepID=A0A5F1YZI6_9LEPT|nr:response regulator [Leptospira gomenensis]TGK36427.1 response regulator [Leptospira gomenensis]TGK38256.1 response regulator [Leptospira gomenensis]TGK45997.1 response regulator [Leptospira gomenensis]TGK65261.1 response regulator [Leptospira gomenensis]
MTQEIDIRPNRSLLASLVSEKQKISFRDPVLIIEDSEEVRALLLQMCKNLGIEAEGFEDGKQALEAVHKKSYSTFIVDLEIPFLCGADFIREIKTLLKDPVILVETGNNDPDTIIEVMKLGVLDYLIKPVDIQVFGQSMKRISEYIQKKETERILQEETETRLRAQLDWILYKQSWLSDLEKTVDVSRVTLNNIKQTFMSGGGIGGIVSLIEIAENVASFEGENCVLPREVVEMLFQNNQPVYKILKSLEKSMEMLNLDTVSRMESVEIGEFLAWTSQIAENASVEMNEVLSEKFIELGFYKQSGYSEGEVQIDRESFRTAFEELIVNAVKYAAEHSKILIYYNFHNGMLNIYVKNEFDPSVLPGVPKEKELLVKQPFYRLAGYVYENFPMETIFSGLGLTIVDIVMRRHSGTFQISNIIDHSISESPIETVLASVSLPVSF